MANRYWVGGTATWDTTTTSVWSASSGGSGGASVPTSTDDVFFDQAGTFTVTISASVVCAALTVSAATYTLTGSSPTLSGSVSLRAGTVFGPSIVFGGTGNYTLTTNGVTVGGLICSSGATINLGSALTTTNGIATFSGGSTLNTLGYAFTTPSFGAFNTGARTFNFSNSTITFSSTSVNGFNWSNATITSSAGSTINFTTTSASSMNLRLGAGNVIPALTFNNGSLTVNISGVSTIRNISSSYVGAKTFTFASGETTTFLAFSLSGTAGNLHTVTASTTAAATLIKPSTWYMGANSTDSGNNTGLTFSAGGGIDYLNVSYITGTLSAATGNFLGFF